jgi:enamine deaminase RidA (YjgF/YER057c/UK114 family)
MSDFPISAGGTDVGALHRPRLPDQEPRLHQRRRRRRERQDSAHRRSGCRLDASGGMVGKGDIAAQTEQVLANVRAALAAGGARPKHIVKWNVYIVEGQPLRAGFAVFRNAWPEVPDPPAITGVIVSGLAHPDFLVEMDAVAVVPQE